MSEAAGRAGRRRGQPAIALVAVLGCWIAARATILSYPQMDGGGGKLATVEANSAGLDAAEPSVAAATSALRQASAAALQGALRFDGPAALPVHADVAVAVAAPTGSPAVRVAITGPQLATGALAGLPLPPEALAVRPAPARRPGRTAPARWSGDSWLLWRREGGGPGAGLGGFAGPSYGASQAGMVLRYRLAPASRFDPQAYLRGSTALDDPRESELAFGLAVRPLASLPATLLVEGRAARSGGHIRLRPAIAVVSTLPPLPLPHSLRGDAYVQAGYVGGLGATAFVDGQARIDRRLVSLGQAELRGGAAAWGGAQRGASRLDLGPSVVLAIPLGKVTARLAADWRFRVAGQAAPSSGPALTLSAGF